MPDATVFDALVAVLRKAAEHNRDDMVAPAAILWPDGERQWTALIPRLREALPEFLTLGEYKAEERTGPAIWLKCALSRSVSVSWPQEAVPVIYLPGVSRNELRVVEACPKHLQPLAELQFRGVIWSHPNGRDWSVTAFLQTEPGGLGLEVAPGPSVQDAAVRALSKLAGLPVAQIQGKRLDTAFFDDLLSGDPERDLLSWLNAPKASKESMTPPEWEAFKVVCRQRFKFDPEKDGELAAAESLGKQQGGWKKAWLRFVESPDRYPGVPKLLRKARPAELSVEEAWPQDNEAKEDELRKAFLELKDKSAAEALTELEELDKEHGERRGWVWAKQGQAPLAKALEQLLTLAKGSATPLGGASLSALADAYAAEGWKVDASALAALAAVEKPGDAKAVAAVLRSIYLPWLNQVAERFQALVKAGGYPPDRKAKGLADAPAGTCLLFADGLRFDVGQAFKAALQERGLQVEAGTGWSAFPSVTPTAKPAVSPIAEGIVGSDIGQEFRPHLKSAGKELTPVRFQKALEERGFQVLKETTTGDPNGKAWTEIGALDSFGHKHGVKLARQVEAFVREFATRVQDLLDAGWKRVHVVTDHGWLLMPEGLPKFELPAYLVETRWGRCAVLKASTKTALPAFPWHWNPEVSVATAPGIGCFKAGLEYDHGGFTLQECLTPEFVVTAQGTPAATVRIAGLKWVGLRCKVSVEGLLPGSTADIRIRPNDPESSLLSGRTPQPVKPDGTVALLVEDDTLEGTSAVVVILDNEGKPATKQSTLIGEN